MNMTRRILLILCAALAAAGLRAQSYEALWKTAQQQADDDLPKSAMATLAKLDAKAKAEGNQTWLLCSTLRSLQLRAELSPDSLTAALHEMERHADDTTLRPVERALWQSALGQTLDRKASRRDTAQTAKARRYIRLSLSDFDALSAASARDYVPYFTLGTDSRHFADDVLNVLARPVMSSSQLFSKEERTAFIGRLIAHYRTRGNRSAVLLCTIDSLGIEPSQSGAFAQKSDYLKLRSMAREYADLPVNVETYIALVNLSRYDGTDNADSLKMAAAREGYALYKKEKRAVLLQNYIARMEQPKLHAYSAADVVAVGDTVHFVAEGRNTRNATLSIFRTPYTTRTLPLDIETAVKGKKTTVATLRPTFRAADTYITATDSLAWTPREAGVYLVAATADGIKTDYSWLYVSDVQPLVLSVQGRQLRITPVERRSGRPVKGCRLVRVKDYGLARGKHAYVQSAVYEPQADGSFVLTDATGIDYSSRFILEAPGDAYSPAFSASYSSRYYFTDQAEKSALRLHVFTDRGIYRPGQTVQFGVIAYHQLADSVNAEAALQLKATLLDANRKEVASQTLTTDALGNASGTFDLPASCLPGNFLVSLTALNGAGSASASMSVEEYKRPTFTATLTVPDVPCRLGDSVRVEGRAETYTGLPLRNARVRWTVRRDDYRFSDAPSEPREGEAVTDDEGRFTVPVVLDGTPRSPLSSYWMPYFRFTVSADVTAESGETASATTAIHASRHGSWLQVEWPQTVCRERPTTARITRCNATGRNIPTPGRYEIRSAAGQVVAADSFATGTPFVPAAFTALPSGRYRVYIYCEGLPADSSAAFTLMSETDTRPQGTEPMSFYVRSASPDSAFVMVGTPLRGVTLFHDVVTSAGIVESRRYELSDSLLHFDFAWRESYGDAARFLFSFVRDGQLYQREVMVQKPVPEKRLTLRWSTFRSLLRPGQQEEWRLRVLRPDGTPAAASLMACLYDASLDALRANPWYFDLMFERRLPQAFASTRTPQWCSVNGLKELRLPAVPAHNFTRPAPELFSLYGGYAEFSVKRALGGRVQGVNVSSNQMLYAARAPQPMASAARKEEMVMEDMVAEAEVTEEKADAGSADGGAGAVVPRTNFSETAFFAPALRTDADGDVSLVFTLPESLTSWNFRALAHDAAMNYGRLDTTVVARKEFMAETHLPRFIRTGDAAEVPVVLRNLTDAPVSGKLHLRLTDAATGRTLHEDAMPFGVEREQVCTFRFTAPAGSPVLVCRVTADGGTFSDGEERYLPVLSDREAVVRSLPYDMTQAGTLTLRIDTLWSQSPRVADRSLTIEASSNPTWYAVAELPALIGTDCHSATAWAVRYYAAGIAAFIAQNNPEIRSALAASGEDLSAWTELLRRNPELKQTLLCETPWVTDADNERAQAAALADLFDTQKQAALQAGALDNLRQLALPCGAWGWYKGMNESPWITAEVALLLARRQTMTGNTDADDLLRRAFAYLEKYIAKDVAEMKKAEKKTGTSFSASELHLKYLYIRALLGKRADADARYLLDKFEKMERPTMYERAMRAVVLSQYGHTEAARKNVASLLEHTVAREGRGRWFDTDRALWCGASYRLPTQCAAIEALVRVAPERKAEVSEMQLWLLQAKRTQGWQMLRATTDAVYALLAAPGTGDTIQPLDRHTPLLYTLCKGRKALAVNAPSQAVAQQAVGYFKQTYADDATLKADNIVLRKQGEGLAWGAVYTRCTLPTAEVAPASAGFTLQRTLEVKRGGKWVPVAEGDAVTKGDRVRQVFRITADRDYDFVSLRSSRAACLEPADALSGYTWRDGEGFYRVVRDASNEYFFDHLRKGTHTFTEECFVDRAGTYTMGTARIQSQYAPEFSATAPSLTLTSR